MVEFGRETFPTTKKDFDLFKRTARSWARKFGLGQWEIEYEHKCTLEHGAHATCLANCDGRLAIIVLGANWVKKPTQKQIKRAAIHEVGHVLTNKIESIALDRFASQRALDEELEALSRALETMAYGD